LAAEFFISFVVLVLYLRLSDPRSGRRHASTLELRR
jgi:hypothetical protein